MSYTELALERDRAYLRRVFFPQKEAASQARYYNKNREKKLLGTEGRRLKYLYGLTYEDRDDLFRAQNYSCAGCGVKNHEYMGDWHIDHCHYTNKVRGIVCFSCNTGLGHAKHKIETLKKWIKYLEKHQ